MKGGEWKVYREKGTDGDLLSASESGTETLQEENAENESWSGVW